jgi:hypothetical protein
MLGSTIGYYPIDFYIGDLSLDLLGQISALFEHPPQQSAAFDLIRRS